MLESLKGMKIVVKDGLKAETNIPTHRILIIIVKQYSISEISW